MTTPSDDEVRRRVREQYGDGIPESASYRNHLPSLGEVARMPAPPGGPAQEKTRALAGQRRHATGAHFEDQLNDTHQQLQARGLGYVVPHYPPTKMIPQRSGPPKLVYEKGGGPCDYSGHVLLDGDVHDRVVPVVFDAKVLDAEHASYRHDPARIAQIFHLRNAHEGGACAFILVRVDQCAAVMAIPYATHGTELLRSLPIPLRDGARPLFPTASYQPGLGWRWPSLIPALWALRRGAANP